MRVNRLPVDHGAAGWNSLLTAAGQAVRLASKVSSDFLIIGGGFAGLAAARRLTQLAGSAKITVLEAKRIGEGPAGRNSGFMIDLPHDLSTEAYAGSLERDRSQIALNRQAIDFARDAVEEYRIDPTEFDERGKVNGAASNATHHHNLEYASHLKLLEEPFELLDQKSMADLTGSTFYKSGLYTPGTVLLQPAAFVRGLASGMGNRISLFEESPVIRLERNGDSWLAKTPTGSVFAGNVILATNGHIESFGFFKRKVFHVMLYASMSRKLNDEENRMTGDDQWGITPSHSAGTTMRKFRNGSSTRIITRNQMTYAPDLQSNEHLVSKMAKRHRNSFEKRYPTLSHIEQEFSWSGRLCLSRNSAPAFGKMDTGLYSACCQNGLGTTRGTLSGMAVAELAAQGRTSLVEAMESQGKPTALPPAPLDTIGANVFMRWSEFKARNEI